MQLAGAFITPLEEACSLAPIKLFYETILSDWIKLNSLKQHLQQCANKQVFSLPPWTWMLRPIKSE